MLFIAYGSPLFTPNRRRELLRVFVERVWADILLVGPYDRTAFYTDLSEVVDVPEFLEYAKGEEVSAIEYSHLAIREGDFQSVVISGRNCFGSRIHHQNSMNSSG